MKAYNRIVVSWVGLIAVANIHITPATASESPPDCLVSKILALAAVEPASERANAELRLSREISEQATRCVEFDMAPLHAAVAIEAEQISKTLLDKKAEVDARGPVSMTPLMIAAQNTSSAPTAAWSRHRP